MPGTVRMSIHKSVHCLVKRNEDFAHQVIRTENLVNQLEIQIDDLAVTLIVLNQPVATDVRLIVAALKINTDLERMGDLAVNTAQRALALIQAPPLEPDSYSNNGSSRRRYGREQHLRLHSGNAYEACLVILADDEVDGLRNSLYEDLARRMEGDGHAVLRHWERCRSPVTWNGLQIMPQTLQRM